MADLARVAPPGHVVVIGAGLVGLATGHFLAEEGIEVTIVDRGSVGGGASRGNAGLVCPGLSDPLPSPGLVRHDLPRLFRRQSPVYLDLRAVPAMAGFLARFARRSTAGSFARGRAALGGLNRRTFDLWDEVAAVGVGALGQSGYLFVSRSLKGASASRQDLVEMARLGWSEMPGPILSPVALADTEPALAGSAAFGYRLVGERWVDPSAVVDRLADSLRRRGVRIVEDAAVMAIVERPDGVEVATTAGAVRADRVVVAAGAWSESIVRTLGIRLGVVPGRGYSLTIRPRRLPAQPIYLADHHVVATPMGERLRLAGTMEFNGWRGQPKPGRLAAIEAAARGLIEREDGDRRTDAWSAPRPMTPDGLPLIGPLPNHPRIVVATGHNMLGLTLAPSTGRVVAELIATGHAEVDLRPFAPTRFASRWSIVRT